MTRKLLLAFGLIGLATIVPQVSSATPLGASVRLSTPAASTAQEAQYGYGYDYGYHRPYYRPRYYGGYGGYGYGGY